jgi:arabinose-5-phosphate isomerase
MMMNARPVPATHDQVQAARDIAEARRVLAAEIEGIKILSDGLNEDFGRAVEVIHAMKKAAGRNGRVIIAGIGKSGHVGRKLAATLASTGTPSYFVHPAEASHGDLGMITESDIVLLLSNSGFNAELSDLITYTRRFGITLIGMTSRSDSPLAQHADIVLLLPRLPEACPNNLAPTTSTTMMLALGDALAVALLERMGLTPEQFKVFHPGGKLGQKLKKVSDIMHGYDALPRVTEDAKMDTVLIALTEKNLGVVLVERTDRRLAGIITDGDLKRHMSPDLLQRDAAVIMTRTPKSIGPDALAAEALELMTRTPGRYLTSLVVMENDRIAGLIRVQDCLQAGIA